MSWTLCLARWLQVLAGVFTFAEIELNPLSKNLMGMPHSKVPAWPGRACQVDSRWH